MKIILSNDILKAQKEYHKYENKLYKLGDVFDRAMEKAGCILCPIYVQYYKEIAFEKRFFNCGNCKYAEKVKKAFRDYSPILMKDNPVLKTYAEAVFEMLSKKKPMLYHIKENKAYQWDQVFPETFSMVDEEMYEALVALVDPDVFDFYSIR